MNDYLNTSKILNSTKPQWLKVRSPNSPEYYNTKKLVQNLKLNTVCESAACPNIGECWKEKHITVMILGSICTRACSFCNISTGKPEKVDLNEPKRVAQVVQELNIEHVVITSVDRDDLKDGGVSQFIKCIEEIRKISSSTTIEVLTPDFLKKHGAVELLVLAKPDVFNHNIETVPSLYKRVRPGARYYNSVNLLDKVKQHNKQIFTKSGVMLGLGETTEEVVQVMDDLRSASVDFLTIGQYLQPSLLHIPVQRYVSIEEFKYLETIARSKGFLMVSASPLTRSSYHAKEDFNRLRNIIQN